MRDTKWVKEFLNESFSKKLTNSEILPKLASKIERFSGKLYKYYSFSKKDSNFALSNLKNDILYFSKPEMFNDPFDCALGFSINESLNAFLPKLINEEIDFNGENSEITKELILSILNDSDEVIDTNNATLDVIKLLIKNPAFKEIIQKVKNGEHIDDNTSKKAFINALKDSKFTSEFYNIILNPKFGIDTSSISKSNLFKIITSDSQFMAILTEGMEPNKEIKKALDLITPIIGANGIVNKLEKAAELTGRQDLGINEKVNKVRNNAKVSMNNFKVRVNESLGITCFSERPDNILMWSYYADKHSGFCVEYDFTKIKQLDALMMLFPVIYSEKRPSIPMTMFEIKDLHSISISSNVEGIADLICALLTKSKYWENEEEWRIIYFLNNLDNQCLTADIISKIYLGTNMSEENEKIIRNIVNKKNHEIPIIKYTLDTEKYKLDLSN